MAIENQATLFPEFTQDPHRLGDWPAKWVWLDDSSAAGAGDCVVAAFRLQFRVESTVSTRLHVSADQRYELFLDGQRLGRGPERGDPTNWFYETYKLSLSPGHHLLSARVWWLTHDRFIAPNAQLTVRPAFLVAAEPELTDLLSTGIAPWEGQRLEGYSFVPPSNLHASHLAGGTMRLDGRQYAWGAELGHGDEWRPAVALSHARDRINYWGEFSVRWRLRPPMLRPRIEVSRRIGTVRHVDVPADAQTQSVVVRSTEHLTDEAANWQAALTGSHPIVVPARSRRRVIVDLDNYYCAFPEIALNGGRDATVRVAWAEGLYEPEERLTRKGSRDAIEGKIFTGRADTFVSDGGEKRNFTTLWWECGRYVEVYVETAEQSLTIDAIAFRETRYPLEMEGAVALSDERFNAVVPLMWRTMQMCSHETYMDCPYYEQLMYTGDTRLEVLVTYVTTFDDRLPRKALEMFAASQTFGGLTQARYPSHVWQIIPQFALFFVAMAYDFALWRGDRELLHRLMPRVRTILDVFAAHVDDDGWLTTPEGWDWVDWVPGWANGRPPTGANGRSGINQWQLVYVLGLAIELHQWLGEDEVAARLKRLLERVARRAVEAYWDEPHGLIADTPEKTSFSEHAQCYALLSNALDEDKRRRVEQGLLSTPDLARATIYFQHYLFECLRNMGRTDAILERMGLWYSLPALGLKTALEMPEPSRSDCHAWSAHPIYHAAASIAGVRPATFGFERVEIRPNLGPLEWAKVAVTHPKGMIRVELTRAGQGLRAKVELPAGLDGTFMWGGTKRAIAGGSEQIIEC